MRFYSEREPENTCPYLDQIIDATKDCFDAIRNGEDDPEEHLHQIDDWANTVRDIASTLREQRSTFEQRVEELESEVSDLESQVVDLKDQLSQEVVHD